MNANPYATSDQSETAYFTDDITLLPLSAIWRICRRLGLTGWVLVFPLFTVRKLLGWTYPANHATCRPDGLNFIAPHELSADEASGLANLEDACRALGMQPLGIFRPPWIGRKSGVFELWLHPSRRLYCNLAYISLSLGKFHKSKAIFACHSKLATGLELHTSSMDPEDWIPELIPPGHDLAPLPAGLAPAEVIEHHLARIADQGEVLELDGDAACRLIVESTQRQIDFSWDRGFLRRIGESELAELRSLSHPDTLPGSESR